MRKESTLILVSFFLFSAFHAAPVRAAARAPQSTATGGRSTTPGWRVETTAHANGRNTAAEEPGSGPGPVELNGNYFDGYLTDTGKIVTAPSRWGKTGWLKAFFVTGVAIGIYTHDTTIRNWVQARRGTATNSISSAATPFGNPLYSVPALGVFYLYGHFGHDQKATETALLSVESVVLSNIFSGAIKMATHRARPYTGEPYNTWNGPSLSFNNDNLSFPSEHATTAFAIASVVASEYRNAPYIPPLAYALATLTAYSRVNDNQHWASDVFVGSAIGYFTGKAIYRQHQQGGNSFFVLPVADGETRGVILSYKF